MQNCLICNYQSFVLKKDLMFAPPEHSSIWDKISKDYNILKCGSCGLEFCDPMPTEEVLKALYTKTYINPRASEEIVRLNAQKNIDYLAKYGLSKDSWLLDFGSGEEDIFRKTGDSVNWKSYDPYLNNNESTGNNDFVTMWGVLEHLVDPIKTMEEVNFRLSDKGKVVITTVFNPFTNIPYNHKPPEHTLYYTEESIKILFKKTGFRILEYSPYYMWQKPEVYLWCIFNSSRMPQGIRDKIRFDVTEPILVPTNEVLIIGEKL